MSQRNKSVAANAPQSWASTKRETSAGRIPAKVSLRARAIVAAEFAKDVDDVNQYAATMYAAKANGTILDRLREQPHITLSKPKVATNSLKTWGSATPRMMREENCWLTEHEVRRDWATDRSQTLYCQTAAGVRPGQAVLDHVQYCDGRIEVRTGNWPESQNQREQGRTRGHGIGKKRDRHVATRQTFTHDSGTYDSGDQESGTDELRNEATQERRCH